MKKVSIRVVYECPLIDGNEAEAREILFKKFDPDQIVEEVVDGQVVNKLMLKDVFNVKRHAKT